jgi:hypothetical protein
VAWDTLVALAIRDHALVYLAANQIGSFACFDSLTFVRPPHELYRVDSFLVAPNPPLHALELVNWRTKAGLQVVMPNIYNSELDGHGRSDVGGNHLIVPTYQGGLSSFCLDDLWFNPGPTEAYAHPGPVTDLTFFRDRLVTGGSRNPLEFYTLDSGGSISFDTAWYGLNNVGAITHSDSMLMVLYPDIDAIYALRVTDDSITVTNDVEVAGSSIRSLRYLWTDPIDTLEAFLAIRLGSVEIYSINSAGEMRYASSASASGRILDAVVADSFLVFTTNKFQLHTYKIYSQFRLIHWYTIATSESIEHLHVAGRLDTYGNQILLGFAASGQSFRITIPKILVPVVATGPSFPVKVARSQLVNDTLFTVGENGLAAFDVSGDFPEPIDYGGFGGHLIARQNRLIVTSDGGSVLTYLLDAAPPGYSDGSHDSAATGVVLRNYPNPFNPSTEIEYSVDREGPVVLTVLNVLGQVVTTLVDEHHSSGLHRVVWDGADDYGARVATGVYLYRLTTPSGSVTRKMMLIK